jgi:hypothetical protein
MNDLYQQLDNQNPRKVKPRTNDGFTNISGSIDDNTPDQHLNTDDDGNKAAISGIKEPPDFIVETSKSKLLTLEVGIRQELDQLLFEHQEVSWDTVVEAALIHCFNNQNSKKRLVKLATERLNARKRTAVHKRSKTMAQKYT